MLEKVKMWLYRARRGQNKDDITGLTAVNTPVLRPLQASDADMTSLQAPHTGAKSMGKEFIWNFSYK